MLDGNPSALPSAIYFLESCDLTASVPDNWRLVLRLDLFPQPNKTFRENYDSPFDKKKSYCLNYLQSRNDKNKEKYLTCEGTTFGSKSFNLQFITCITILCLMFFFFF